MPLSFADVVGCMEHLYKIKIFLLYFYYILYFIIYLFVLFAGSCEFLKLHLQICNYNIGNLPLFVTTERQSTDSRKG